jgi:putative transcriptional regulator
MRKLNMSKKTKGMTGTELGNMLLESVRQMKAGKAARVTQIATNQVAAARLKSGLSQTDFAQALQISPRTLQEWEQGRREPSGAAKALIEIAFRHPEVIREGLLG